MSDRFHHADKYELSVGLRRTKSVTTHRAINHQCIGFGKSLLLITTSMSIYTK